MCDKRNKQMNLENCGEENSVTEDTPCDCDMSQESHSSQESLYPQKCIHKLLIKKKVPPHIQHDVNMAKSILQEMSSISGNNLYVYFFLLIMKVLYFVGLITSLI